ncbi:unnamed protein product [Bursaphelenchus okinawaensis]|uniref:Peptidase C1A papain C-terminal domain-containing protein n=1 Tax=Bursaphelenchus okinawaensis TaxID=465554 RepID=A0A811JVQ0_9BILA|nr:unnamed protein product [Bursaphelenchus okinawaensis]CAG9085242.1 unnamed protein product [Bursaphelenchus okinawaensis]
MKSVTMFLLVSTVTAKLATFTPYLKDHEELSEEAQNLSGQKLVDYINNLETTWTATSDHKFKQYRQEHYGPLLGLRDVDFEIKSQLGDPPIHNNVAVPDEFDSRKVWPKCESIRTIRDQSTCGSCWAVAATSTMSDRICIHSNGTKQVDVSADDLISCCKFCGLGCFGGAPEAAWVYYMTKGLVSGGAYGDNSTCRSYPFAPCEHHVPGPKPACGGYSKTPKCERTCSESSGLTYNNDIHQGKIGFPVRIGEWWIKNEIYNNGPVEAGFTVFEDFINYKSGVYQHKAGKMLGGHAVKIIGWGVENGTNYWLVANSWNEDWGVKGYFKILRGHFHCGIEYRVSAGLPKL